MAVTMERHYGLQAAIAASACVLQIPDKIPFGELCNIEGGSGKDNAGTVTFNPG